MKRLLPTEISGRTCGRSRSSAFPPLENIERLSDGVHGVQIKYGLNGRQEFPGDLHQIRHALHGKQYSACTGIFGYADDILYMMYFAHGTRKFDLAHDGRSLRDRLIHQSATHSAMETSVLGDFP